jgi:truncated hemoglobin YjbI
VIAFHTFEIADIIPGRARHDEGEHHAVLTTWTAGTLDGNEGGVWPHMRLRHVTHPLIRREHDTLIHR